MGIFNFSKTFENKKNVSVRKYAGKKLAVDAMTEIYRAALGMARVDSFTDQNGNPTAHIITLINNISKFNSIGIQQIWVFDNSEADPDKAAEDAKRNSSKESAEKKKKKMESEVFSEDEASDDDASKTKSKRKKDKEQLKSDIKKLEKRTFRITDNILKEVFIILEGFGIPYIISPPGVQAENVCAALTRLPKTSPLYCIAVLSPDTDALLFGAVRVLKRIKGNTDEFEKYSLANILEKYELTHEQFVGVGIVLGCDFYHDKEAGLFKGIGPKKVIGYVKGLASYKNIADYGTNIKKEGPKKAYKKFIAGTTISPDELIGASKLFITKLTDAELEKNKTKLLRWLVDDKAFKEHIWSKRIFK